MRFGKPTIVTLAAGLLMLTFSAQIFAEDKPNAETNNPEAPPPTSSSDAGMSTISPEQLLKVPVSGLTPGAVDARPKLNLPPIDEKAAQRGMENFASFNCVGCHMGNGGGGMGPALSNHAFIYGSSPENIFLSIYQGRPNGMPAWGTVLPEDAIWDLVAYIKNLSNAPVSQWGSTVSSTSPAIEQVPVEIKAGANPWQYTQKFSKGQKPQE
ncbi:c-type cytochrome [Hyphomicrobium sp.]|jgi:cytochrome c oxidase cbb3-type subunit 3|uniref:c-type cytochrome n=1 Tax=Hyphomicrobium sp. TaxID=82 RepID=UPI002B65EB67|nr:c-type cytochrome [Hyphomicrobium sp.]HVZ04842.1 c-type cytochrome [Hyphomicrobium sp.]